MTVASFVAAQRTEHAVPHAKCCRWLGVSASWFYKWQGSAPDGAPGAPAEFDAAVKASFDDSGGTPGTYGSPRVFEDLDRGRLEGVGQHGGRLDGPPGPPGPLPETQAPLADPPGQGSRTDSGPCEAGLQRRGSRPALVWGPDRDPHRRGEALPGDRAGPRSRRLPGFALGEHHDSALAKAALCMAAAVRGGEVAGVVFHTDKGGEYVGDLFARACAALRVTQSMGRVGSALDNAAAESFNSTLEWELLPPALRHQGPGPPRGRPVHRRLQPPAPPQQLRDAPGPHHA